MGLFTYIHVVGVVSGIWGSLYHVNALRLQSTLVIIIIIFSDWLYGAQKN